MPDFLRLLFDTSDFPARWHCGQWTTGHGYLHIVSDVAIFAAYVGIPTAIAVFVSRRRDSPFPRLFWLFSLFILFCGTTHLVEAMLFWHPVYRVLGVLKLCTAIVSMATLFKTIAVVPQALRLKTPTELEAVVAQRTAALERSEADLKLAHEQLTALLHSVSHDLKAPIVTIKGFAAALREDLDAGDTESALDSLARIERAGHRMDNMVGDLQVLNRAGRTDERPALLPLRAELVATVEQHAQTFEKKGIEVAIDDDLPATVYATPSELSRILDNLLLNAVKYGCPHAGSKIEVGATEATTDQGSDVTLWVRDFGPGVRDADKERIFLAFKRAHADSNGTGLGLAIVARIADLYGGRAWVEDAHPGARFLVRFPTPKPS